MPERIAPQRYDVIEVQFSSEERLIAKNLNRDDAEATINLAVIRRGVETSFFVARPTSEIGAGE